MRIKPGKCHLKMFKKKGSDVFLANVGPSVAFAFFLCLFVLFNLIK